MFNAAVISACIAVAAVLGAPKFFLGSLLLHLALVASTATDHSPAAAIHDGIKAVRQLIRLPIWVARCADQAGITVMIVEIVDLARHDPAKVGLAVLASLRGPARFLLRCIWFQSLVLLIATITAIAVCLEFALLVALSSTLVLFGVTMSLAKTGVKAGCDWVDFAARLSTAVTCVWHGGMAQLGIDALRGLQLAHVTRRRPHSPWARWYTPRAGVVDCTVFAWCQPLIAAVTSWLSGETDPYGNATELGGVGFGLAYDSDYAADVMIKGLKALWHLCRHADAVRAANLARRQSQRDPANLRKQRILADKERAATEANEVFYMCHMDVVCLACATPLDLLPDRPAKVRYALNTRQRPWEKPAYEFVRFTLRPRLNAIPKVIRLRLLEMAEAFTDE